MSNNIDIQPIKEKLSAANTVLVLFGKNPTVDHVASALALTGVFKTQRKQVTVASPAEMRAEFSRLVGLDHVTDEISNRDLVIGFNNHDFSDVEKVSVNESADGRFELIIEPKANKEAPDKKQIDFSYRGIDADMIFLVGVKKLEELDTLYEADRNFFNKTDIISFNRREAADYASMSFYDKEASSLAEIVTQFLQQIEFEPKGDIASNLLAGIDFSTNRFQNPMISPSAFTIAGQLLQNGAKRQPPRMTPPGVGSGGFMPFVPPSSHNKPPQGAPKPDTGKQLAQQTEQKNPPQDWLKPKIYSGGSPSKV